MCAGQTAALRRVHPACLLGVVLACAALAVYSGALKQHYALQRRCTSGSTGLVRAPQKCVIWLVTLALLA